MYVLSRNPERAAAAAVTFSQLPQACTPQQRHALAVELPQLSR